MVDAVDVALVGLIVVGSVEEFIAVVEVADAVEVVSADSELKIISATVDCSLTVLSDACIVVTIEVVSDDIGVLEEKIVIEDVVAPG